MKSHKELEYDLREANDGRTTQAAVDAIKERSEFIRKFDKEHPEEKGKYIYPSLDAVSASNGGGSALNQALDKYCFFYEFNYLEKVYVLISAGANINSKDRIDDTPLLTAVMLKDTRLIKVLIAAGANVNVHDCIGHTPLMIAAKHGDSESVKLLLEAKADIHAKTGRVLSVFGIHHVFGKTALQHAMKYGQYNCEKLLLEAEKNENNSKKGFFRFFSLPADEKQSDDPGIRHHI